MIAFIFACLPLYISYEVPTESVYDDMMIVSLVDTCHRHYNTCPALITKLGYRDWDARCKIAADKPRL